MTATPTALRPQANIKDLKTADLIAFQPSQLFNDAKTADYSPQPINHQLLVIRAAFSRLDSSICAPRVVV